MAEGNGKLAGKVALVSGSGRGIGRAIALKLASEGAKLVVNDLDDGPAGETIAAIEAAGGSAVACNGDVAATDFGTRIIKTAVITSYSIHYTKLYDDRVCGLPVVQDGGGVWAMKAIEPGM